MHLSSCLNPQKVFNKYTNETLYVPCGKCAACANARSKKWIEKMNKEAECWKYTFSLYLDYDEQNVPYYQQVGDFFFEQNPRFYKHFTFEEICIPISEFNLEKDYEFEYVFDRINDTYGIPHPSVRDIQTFKKRLNKWLFKHVTGHYQNFRSCIAAEYGPTTFRGHYHGILYFNDDRVAARIAEAVAACWTFGHTTCEPPTHSKSAVAGYVAQYITRPTNLPAFYAHPKVRPFFLTSRHPPIGSLYESSEEIRKIFLTGSCERSERIISEGIPKISSVPLSACFRNHLFPKCPRFNTLPDSCRVELYRCLLQRNEAGELEPYYDFTEAYFQLRRKLGVHWLDSENSYVENGQLSDSWLCHFLFEITDGFKNIASIVSLYRNTKRIFWQAKIFGVSFDEYLQKIFSFYHNLELYRLKKFYEFQFEYSKSYSIKDLKYAYPDYIDVISKFPRWRQEYIDINDAIEFKLYKAHSEHIYEESHKRQKQNGYLEKLKDKNPLLHNLISKYYAKKCDETNEAVPLHGKKRLRLVSPCCKYTQLRRAYAVFKYPDRAQW